MSDADAAQLIAGLALTLLTVVLAIVGRTDTIVESDSQFTLPDGTVHTVTRGTVLPKEQAQYVGKQSVKAQRRSALGALISGKDHRTSTSKTVVFAWSLAVAFGLLSLLVAVWLGDHEPWDAQVARGLQEEYLLLLGGPFAAAILAKYAAVSQSEAKTDAPVGTGNASQLIDDDQGDTDLGDFQYVLFNVIALAFFLGDFIGDLGAGFPVLPPILTGLVLTSTGGYAAKKLISQATPALTSVLPAAAPRGATVRVFGSNLLLPAAVSGSGETMRALVLVGPLEAEVIAHDLILGNDRLTIKVPVAAKAGLAPISASRADGVGARGPSGTNALAFEVLEGDAEHA
jgi:hypothetical protein